MRIAEISDWLCQSVFPSRITLTLIYSVFLLEWRLIRKCVLTDFNDTNFSNIHNLILMHFCFDSLSSVATPGRKKKARMAMERSNKMKWTVGVTAVSAVAIAVFLGWRYNIWPKS